MMEIQADLFAQESYPVLSAVTYEEFRGRLQKSGCRLCRLHESRQNIVVDRGNPESEILAVGEGPGQNEDLEGKAFVGRAGQLLDEIMKAAGIDTNRDMLIANVVKCRPPQNRLPQASEAHTCLPYLKKQIALMKPKVILLLGATAMKYLLETKSGVSMEKEVGRIFRSELFPGIDMMLLYHPAFLLRDPRKKKDMWQHIKVLCRHLDEKQILSTACPR